MKLIVVLSGPKTTAQQAKTALAAAGLTVTDATHSHGLAGRKSETGKRGRQAVAFLTVESDGDDPTPARDAVVGLGWQLRSHRVKGPPLKPSLGVTLARMQAEIDALKGARHGG
ncbi:MAG TPA: hypothetical protein VGF95_14465 [Solirubrobacteraceae bacterium]|jgi:hypothetical protein